MKKFILVILVFIPLIHFGQVKIVLNDGTIINTKIDGFYGEDLVFTKKLPDTNIDRVNIMDVDSISGSMPNSRVKSILKKNPAVHFSSNQNFTDAVYYAPSAIASGAANNTSINGQYTAGDYIQRAGTRYVTGLALGLGGAVVMAVGADSQEAIVAGSLISLTGAIISITGHFQLIKAGKKMNSDAVTLSPATHGIGMAINF
jgi:hypothetical protein